MAIKFPEEFDRETVVDAIEFAREIAAQPALDTSRGAEVLPGAKVETKKDLLRFAEKAVITFAHVVGTFRMFNGETVAW